MSGLEQGSSAERLPLLGSGSIQGGNGETGDGHTGKNDGRQACMPFFTAHTATGCGL